MSHRVSRSVMMATLLALMACREPSAAPVQTPASSTPAAVAAKPVGQAPPPVLRMQPTATNIAPPIAQIPSPTLEVQPESAALSMPASAGSIGARGAPVAVATRENTDRPEKLNPLETPDGGVIDPNSPLDPLGQGGKLEEAASMHGLQ